MEDMNITGPEPEQSPKGKFESSIYQMMEVLKTSSAVQAFQIMDRYLAEASTEEKEQVMSSIKHLRDPIDNHPDVHLYRSLVGAKSELNPK